MDCIRIGRRNKEELGIVFDNKKTVLTMIKMKLIVMVIVLGCISPLKCAEYEEFLAKAAKILSDSNIKAEKKETISDGIDISEFHNGKVFLRVDRIKILGGAIASPRKIFEGNKLVGVINNNSDIKEKKDWVEVELRFGIIDPETEGKLYREVILINKSSEKKLHIEFNPKNGHKKDLNYGFKNLENLCVDGYEFKFIKAEADKDHWQMGHFKFRWNGQKSIRLWGIGFEKDGSFRVRFENFSNLTGGKWQEVPVGYCGTGSEMFSIEPNKDYVLKIPLWPYQSDGDKGVVKLDGEKISVVSEPFGVAQLRNKR